MSFDETKGVARAVINVHKADINLEWLIELLVSEFESPDTHEVRLAVAQAYCEWASVHAPANKEDSR